MNIIEINGITKDYGNNKGVFDVSFSVSKGEVVGFLGPNGAGKTTTIRQLMGFCKPDKGACSILGMNCQTHTAAIQERLGYLPGEISFMDDMNGMEFIRFIGAMKGIKDFSKANELINRFELNPNGKIKKMSKGMKQKIGIVCAFMQEAEVLILDEPTSGLDPLMQNLFVELIEEEKAKGVTILMSSHMFEEVEKTCDRTVIIKEGRIVANKKIEDIQKAKRKIFKVLFRDEAQAKSYVDNNSNATVVGTIVTVKVDKDINAFIRSISNYDIINMDIEKQTLEDLFIHFYGGEK